LKKFVYFFYLFFRAIEKIGYLFLSLVIAIAILILLSLVYVEFCKIFFSYGFDSFGSVNIFIEYLFIIGFFSNVIGLICMVAILIGNKIEKSCRRKQW